MVGSGCGRPEFGYLFTPQFTLKAKPRLNLAKSPTTRFQLTWKNIVMNITHELIDKLSTLSRLNFEGADREEIKLDLERMLNFVGKLEELDTHDVTPLIYMTEETNRMREDEPESPITHDEALSNAPARDSEYFRVPKVLRK